MIIHDYETRSGKVLIKDYILRLPEDEKIDGLSVLKDMEEDKFDSLLFKRWESKVYEVYFRKHNRIFYIIADENNLYLLHACRKQKNSTEKTDSDLVRRRAKELGRLLNRIFI
jgi:phage-related protein